MKINKKISALIIVGMTSFSTISFAAATVQVGNGLYVPSYTSQEMSQAGCDPQNWNKLVQQYVARRTAESKLEGDYTTQWLNQAPKANQGVGSCLQQASNAINNTVNQISSAASGLSSLNVDSIINSVVNRLGEAACKQLDNMTGQAVSSVTGGINNAIGGATSTLNNTGVNVGGTNFNIGNTITNPTTGTPPWAGTPQNGNPLTNIIK